MPRLASLPPRGPVPAPKSPPKKGRKQLRENKYRLAQISHPEPNNPSPKEIPQFAQVSKLPPKTQTTSPPVNLLPPEKKSYHIIADFSHLLNPVCCYVGFTVSGGRVMHATHQGNVSLDIEVARRVLSIFSRRFYMCTSSCERRRILPAVRSRCLQSYTLFCHNLGYCHGLLSSGSFASVPLFFL